ncbi:serine hydrolase [Persicitalea jodogahamensis]|uniref:beta-lactamase n=1 Tax=Persicitalea jodogahamensis TaxID=402147 RepID=A0A8J3G867_9BACT|nr:serine hydrolase [Persicitalea jodogahamensis]GHB53899.1 D-alanyl-D-alanine carboxypeptidase [Persicitalea jodogahamensis]
MKALKIIGIIVGVLVLAFAGLAAYAYLTYFNFEGDYVANFIAKNKQKSALYWVRNDSLMAEQNPSRKMPLASTVKIIIAIEFAEQVSSGKIDPAEQVPLSELSRFYIDGTDGGAHPAWLKQMKEKNLVAAGTASLLEIAKGMIRHSSNANTEYLMWRLGLAPINANLIDLGLTKHDSLYPFVSALYVCSEENSAKGLKLMGMDLYKKKSMHYFEVLKMDTTIKERFNRAHVSAPVQRVWSDRLPGSTVREYDGILQKIQSRTYFDPTTQKTLEEIMEWPMEAFDTNRKKYLHLGAKGGSTAFVLTYALYATDQKGDRTRLTFFFDDLTTVESTFLQAMLGDFQQKVLSGDEKERQAILKTLNTTTIGD